MTNQTSAADSSYGDDRNPQPDAQGQAALLLLESIIHSLLDNGALTKHQAIEAIDRAMQVKAESANEEKESSAILQRSLQLLVNMRRSLEAHDGRYDPDTEAGPQSGQGR